MNERNSNSALWRALCSGADVAAPELVAVTAWAEQAHHNARQHWSESQVNALPLETFAQALGRSLRSRPVSSWLDGLQSINAEDLYLALAAAGGDDAALGEVDRRIGAVATRVAKRMGDDSGDVAQLLRVRALVADETGGVRLSQYTGRGSLVSWLRVVATRSLLNERRRLGPPVQSEDELAEPIATSTPEVALLRAESRAVFVDALRQALLELEKDERDLLRAAMVEAKTVTVLGEELGVHPATAARRIGRARQKLLSGFRDRLRQAVEDSVEAEQLLAILRSRIELSDRSALASSESSGSP